MKRKLETLTAGAAMLLCSALAPAMAAPADLASATEGTIHKIDSAGKTVVVKTADGAEETYRFSKRTAVHGAKAAGQGTAKGVEDLEEGSRVVVHYSAKGAEKTAIEVDRVGEGGLHVAEGTVKSIDHGAKKIAIVTSDGAAASFLVTGQAIRNLGHGVEKSGKVTVYYTEDAGKKIAHFCKRAA